jgi:hypothetical protein
LAVVGFAVGVVAPRLPRVVGPPEVQENRNFTWSDVKQVRLWNANGAIEVHSHSASVVEAEARVRAYSRVPGQSEAVRTYVASLFHVKNEGGVLEIITEPAERPPGVEILVDYSLRLPEGTDLDLESVNGNVSVFKGCGQVRVKGRNADIEVSGPLGSVTAETLNGRVRVLDTPSDATLSTVNGNIYAWVLGGRLSATTANGLVIAHVLKPDVQQCELTSQNGGITVVMSEGCSARLEARTELGGIRVDLPIETSNGVEGSRSLVGVIGRGDTQLRVNTLNGNIRIAKG